MTGGIPSCSMGVAFKWLSSRERLSDCFENADGSPEVNGFAGGRKTAKQAPRDRGSLMRQPATQLQ